MKRLLPIVEGEGDERAVPVLLRRILHAHDRFDVEILRPHRRGDLPKVKANFDRFFQAAVLEEAAVICILDFDCEFCVDVVTEEACFGALAEHLRPGHPFAACFIVKEFESLFLSDEVATRSALPAIHAAAAFPQAPEAIRDAKGWLSAAQPSGSAYKPTAHQTKIVSQLNLDHLRIHSPSYQRLERATLALTDQA